RQGIPPPRPPARRAWPPCVWRGYLGVCREPGDGRRAAVPDHGVGRHAPVRRRGPRSPRVDQHGAQSPSPPVRPGDPGTGAREPALQVCPGRLVPAGVSADRIRPVAAHGPHILGPRRLARIVRRGGLPRRLLLAPARVGAGPTTMPLDYTTRLGRLDHFKNRLALMVRRRVFDLFMRECRPGPDDRVADFGATGHADHPAHVFFETLFPYPWNLTVIAREAEGAQWFPD